MEIIICCVRFTENVVKLIFIIEIIEILLSFYRYVIEALTFLR